MLTTMFNGSRRALVFQDERHMLAMYLHERISSGYSQKLSGRSSNKIRARVLCIFYLATYLDFYNFKKPLANGRISFSLDPELQNVAEKHGLPFDPTVPQEHPERRALKDLKELGYVAASEDDTINTRWYITEEGERKIERLIEEMKANPEVEPEVIFLPYGVSTAVEFGKLVETLQKTDIEVPGNRNGKSFVEQGRRENQTGRALLSESQTETNETLKVNGRKFPNEASSTVRHFPIRTENLIFNGDFLRGLDGWVMGNTKAVGQFPMIYVDLEPVTRERCVVLDAPYPTEGFIRQSIQLPSSEKILLSLKVVGEEPPAKVTISITGSDGRSNVVDSFDPESKLSHGGVTVRTYDITKYSDVTVTLWIQVHGLQSSASRVYISNVKMVADLKQSFTISFNISNGPPHDPVVRISWHSDDK